jgi:small subunit ribosomal protein S16
MPHVVRGGSPTTKRQGDTTLVAVKIRLKRMGKVRAPHYRVVVVDSRKKRDGRVIEEIGKYHPKEEPSLIDITSERAQYWLGVGAQPSEAVAAILKVTGDWQKFKGLPGAEGTLKTAAPKRDKAEIFNEALKESSLEPQAEAVTTKSSKKAPASASDAPEAPSEHDVVGGQSPESAVESAERAETQAVDAEKTNRDNDETGA